MSDLQVVNGMVRSGPVAFHPDLAQLMRPIDDVIPAPYNYNNGDVEAIVESITENGMYAPVLVQKSTGYVVKGNHTWLACKELGAHHIPVVVVDVNEIRAKKMMVADNQTARLARPDLGQLEALLNEIREVDPHALSGTGFTVGDLEVIEHLNQIALDTKEREFAQWPSFSVQVHPNVMRAFRHMTREADTDGQAFELLLRLAGWDGHE